MVVVVVVDVVVFLLLWEKKDGNVFRPMTEKRVSGKSSQRPLVCQTETRHEIQPIRSQGNRGNQDT